LNSKERVLTTLNRQVPDMVPLDLGGNQSGLHIVAYRNLLEHLEIEDYRIQYCDFVQQAALPCEELLQRFQIDVRWLRPKSTIVPEDHVPETEGEFQGVWDEFGVFWGNSAEKHVDEILYYDPVIHPLADVATVQGIREYDWPDGTDRTPLNGLREQAKKLRETTDYAIATPPLGCIYEYTTFLVKFGEEYYVDIVSNNGDLAAQRGPIMSPQKVYVPIIKPIEKRFSEKLHRLADVKINYHSCGSVPHFIPHFSEIGYDAISPVQVGAFDMEPCSLKSRFGDSITFWGGLCNSQSTLPFGTPEKIREEVKHNMTCFKPGGGYIASNVHNILSEVPPENIVAMFDAAIESRHY